MVGRDHRATVALSLALVAASWVGSSARAQEPSEPDEGWEAQFQEGVAHLRAGRHAEAAGAFRASYRLEPRVETMCNLALTYDRWGPQHHENAARAYRTCAADDETGRYRAHAQRRVEEIERELVLRDEPAEGAATDAETRDAGPEPDAIDDGGATPPPTEAGHDHVLLWPAGGAAVLSVAGLIVGASLALDAQGQVAQLESDVGPTGRIEVGSPEDARLSRARATADGAVAAYVLSGVFAAAAVGLLAVDLVLASDGSGEAAVALSPRPGGAALTLRRRF